jgi:predicted glycosyltransferase
LQQGEKKKLRLLIDINHPAHVHFFRHFAGEMTSRGHRVLFTAREKDVAVDLLKEFQLDFISLGKHYKHLAGKLWGMIKYDLMLLGAARRFKPHLVLSISSIYAAQAAFLSRTPHIAFEDSEPVLEHRLLCFPFTKVILTPFGFNKDLGRKQVRYKGFHELSYLHPGYFTPDASVLPLLGVAADEKFAILRFVSFKAGHDIGIAGFSKEDKIQLVKRLQRFGKVFISSEGFLPRELQAYRLPVLPGKLQDALYYAHLYLGDSQTMATEAALLGTPAIRCNTWVNSPREMSNFIELEEKYRLLLNYNIKDRDKAIEEACRIFESEDIKKEWQKNRERLLTDKIDVTAFMIWFVENYPGSVNTFKNDPEYQNRFRGKTGKDLLI